MDNNDFDKNEFGENDYAFKIVNNNGKPKSYGWSVAALLFGILSVITFFSGYAAVVFAVLSAVFAIISRKKLGYFDRICIGGLVLGIIGLVLGVAMILGNIFMSEEIKEQYRKILEDYFKLMSSE